MDGSSTALSSVASSCCLHAAMVALGRAVCEWPAASAVLPKVLGLGAGGDWGTPRGRSLLQELK